MAAFNWVLIKDKCPSCKTEAEIECQTHIAASFDGDESGRFCNRTYHLGEKLPWWTIESKKYDEWRVNGKEDFKSKEIDYECCYSKCLSCKAEIYVILEFKEQTPIKVIGVGRESEWPPGYMK